MKHTRVSKRILLPFLLILTLTAMMFAVSAADTAKTDGITDPAARIVVTSKKTNETTETLFSDVNSAILALHGWNNDSHSSIALELLKPIKGYPYMNTIRCGGYDLTLDLGGFTHEIRSLAFDYKGNFTIRNGTLKGTGPMPFDIYRYGENNTILLINHPEASVIIEQSASVLCKDITLIADEESEEDTVLTYYSNPTVLIRNGTLINYGQIVSGSMEADAVVVINGASLYNHGTIAGGNADIAKHYKYGGNAVNGNVVLNTGVIRGGDMTGIGPDYVSAQGGWGVFGDVEDNRGQILGGSANVTIENGYAIAGMAVFGKVDNNSGEIRSGTAVNNAKNCEESIIVQAVYDTVSVNTGTISPIAFAQTDLTVYIDGEALTSDTPYPFYDGKAHSVTYSLTFGGKEVAFEDITHTLTLNSEEVTELMEAGKYTLTISCGEETKNYPLSVRPAHPFTDITEDHPYYADIAGVYQKGLMNGTEPNVFSPDVTLSRAMLVTMLWRMEGCPVVNYAMQFSDVSQEEWYAEAIRWAAAEGIVLGYDDGTFGVDNPITLEQMSVILYRYEQYKGGGFTGLWMFRLNYEDIADISEWAYEAVCYMVMKDVYCTPTETLLQPQKQATRAEAAVFLNRYAELRANAEADTADN